MAWHVKTSGGYSNDSTEAIENAKMCADVLMPLGWTANAVAGLLGNASAESAMNPWRWQSDIIGSTGGSPWTNSGYGLVQFTPAGKYINAAQSYAGYGPNFSNQTGKDTDGQAQLLFINDNADYYATTAYPLNFSQFKASTETGGYLAKAWLYNYERPADPSATESARESSGDYWQGILTGYTPTPGGKTLLYGGIRDVLRRLIIHA